MNMPPISAIKLGWPVNYHGAERYVTGISRDPKDQWITINGSNEQLRLSQVEWIRDCYWSDAGDTAKKVRLW